LADIPEGFTFENPAQAFATSESWFSLIGPVYRRADLPPGQSRLGFASSAKHKNYLQQVHGGMLAAFFDYVVWNAAFSVWPGGCVTLNMTINYISAAPLDAWIEGAGEVVRAGKQVAFCQGVITAGDKILGNGSAAFRKIERENSR